MNDDCTCVWSGDGTTATVYLAGYHCPAAPHPRTKNLDEVGSDD